MLIIHRITEPLEIADRLRHIVDEEAEVAHRALAHLLHKLHLIILCEIGRWNLTIILVAHHLSEEVLHLLALFRALCIDTNMSKLKFNRHGSSSCM